MHEWSPAQLAAIKARNHRILVSAAAGSGKTSVLIERVMDLLRGGAELERMLIVTFTHAAAGEMRERLSLALAREARENAHLRRQYAAIGRADISTLHTFCGRLIRRYAQAAQVDPMSRIADESRAGALRQRAIDEAMEALYEAPGPDGEQLITQYSDSQIEEMLGQLYRFLMSQDRPWAWLEQYLAEPEAAHLTEHPWYRYALDEAQSFMQGALQLAEGNLLLTDLPQGPARYHKTALEDRELALLIQQSLLKTGRLPEGSSANFSRLSSAKAQDSEDPALAQQFKDCRDEFKDLIKLVYATLPASQTQMDKALHDIAYTWPALRALGQLCRQMHAGYQALKEARQLWDYNDLEHLALSCLMDDSVATDVQAGFDALFVDEYQDISRIQEAIIQRLHGGHATLFMVGDVKQSIYRFRLADPGLFLDKHARYAQEDEAPERLINLSANYRSRQNVLAAVNHVFYQTMRQGALEIRYDADAALYPGLPSQDDPPIELHLILDAQALPKQEDAAPTDDEEDSAQDEGEIAGGPENEAEQIAQRIIALKDSGQGYSYRDMVILLRSASGRAARMAQVLQRHGIPVYSDADQQYFDLIEVQDALNLLHVLDNPLQDEPLLAVLGSPTFGYTSQDFADIRGQGARDLPFHEIFYARRDSDPRAQAVLDQLDLWRFRCQQMPLEAFLRQLIRDSGLYTRAGLKYRGELRRANLRLLCERAAPDPLPQTLHGFLSRVSEARQQDSTKAAAALGAGEDLVRIMTVHKSKGLEFPIVFLPDLARQFKLGSQGELLHLDHDSGLALRKVDPDRRMTYQTFAGKAIQLKKNAQQRSEEARLLYVAMTRARDRLILLASPKHVDSQRRRWALPEGDWAARSARSMLDWLGQSLWPLLQPGTEGQWTAPNGSHWLLRLHAAQRLDEGPEGERGDIPLATQAPSQAIRDYLAPLPAQRPLPLKMSVTQLISGLALDEEIEETAQTKRFALESRLKPLPSLQREPPGTAVARGVATHRALSSLPLEPLHHLRGDALLAAISQGLDDMCAQGVLSDEERQAVNARQLSAFLDSPLGQRMLKAERLQREWPFSLMVEEGLILQGVLDCCFMEGGAWVLIDYKTDRADIQQIELLYRDQMRWYMRALRDITGLPVKEAYLYALQHGQLIAVSEDAPIRLM